MSLLYAAIIVFILNVPFGYWRAFTRRFSIQWFLSIHLPIPIVVLVRIYGGIGFAWYTYVALVTAFFLGQFLGQVLKRRFTTAK